MVVNAVCPLHGTVLSPVADGQFSGSRWHSGQDESDRSRSHCHYGIFSKLEDEFHYEPYAEGGSHMSCANSDNSSIRSSKALSERGNTCSGPFSHSQIPLQPSAAMPSPTFENIPLMAATETLALQEPPSAHSTFPKGSASSPGFGPGDSLPSDPKPREYKFGDLGEFWGHVDKMTNQYHDELVKGLKSNLDNLLIFVSSTCYLATRPLINDTQNRRRCSQQLTRHLWDFLSLRFKPVTRIRRTSC